MKKVMIIAALAFMTMTVQAQMSVDRLMRKYKHSPKAEYVHVPKMMMTLAKAIKTGDADDYTKYLKHIDSIKVLDMEDCSKAVKQQFFKDVTQLKTAGYEELMTAKEADEQTIIMVKRSKTGIKELVIVESDNDDAALIQILGNIKNSEIQKIVADKKKK
ncbi:DUF4252 domain-containing protein [Hoylesella buccalis]|uniref:DUF4252 domain-containing protein n=1 Tax=Hoylesella buccalis DNF00853 TaxID=1401074 RepID=A0A096BT35_9BACT|nr:DUF4252 domain-containing protein [Hoylesella buccalis]KGF36329.1 hypothetical protein HMPREF2137_02465 [Hoylesella buccalis DNF00853]